MDVGTEGAEADIYAIGISSKRRKRWVTSVKFLGAVVAQVCGICVKVTIARPEVSSGLSHAKLMIAGVSP